MWHIPTNVRADSQWVQGVLVSIKRALIPWALSTAESLQSLPRPPIETDIWCFLMMDMLRTCIMMRKEMEIVSLGIERLTHIKIAVNLGLFTIFFGSCPVVRNTF